MIPGSVPEISGLDTGFVNATRTKTATVNPRNGGGGRENGGAFGRLAHPELVGCLRVGGDGRRRPESSGRASGGGWRRTWWHGWFEASRLDSFGGVVEDDEAELLVVFVSLGDSSINGGELGHGS